VQIAIPLFPDLTVLDATGPNEILGRLPGVDVRFVGAAPGPVRSESAGLQLVVEHRYEDVPAPGVVLMPGGTGTRALLRDERVLGWLRAAHATSTWTTSVCTGSLVLAAAGILDGVEATTHWLQRDLLGRLGARPVADRVVERGKVITAAGVSSGIDMALVLAERLAGRDVAMALQLMTEYDPQPPFDAGAPEKAPAHVVEHVRGEVDRRVAAASGVAGA
jgi:transcriptional regulator GlxA family with amidase domain